jgi:hypothetical protein
MGKQREMMTASILANYSSEPVFISTPDCGHRVDSPWHHDNEWACAYCTMISNMGTCRGNHISLTLPEKMELSVVSLDNNSINRLAMKNQILLQHYYQNTPNPLLAVAECNGKLKILQKTPTGTVPSSSLWDVIKTLRQEAGWSYPRAFDGITSDMVFAYPESMFFGVRDQQQQRCWVSNDVCYFQFLNGKGYPGYTEVCVLLALAKTDPAAHLANPMWSTVFGAQQPLVHERLLKTTSWSSYAINKILRGVSLCALF